MSNQMRKNQDEINSLKEERKKLLQKLADIEADYRKGLSADSEDRAVELENADVLNGIATAISEQIASIDVRISELE